MTCMQRSRRVALIVSVVMGLWVSLGSAQVVDMSNSWLVKKLNDSACDSLFILRTSEIEGKITREVHLSPAVDAWYAKHPDTQGQAEYYFAEGAYKCAFATSEMATFLEFSLTKFKEASVYKSQLSENQQTNMEYRKAWAELRLAELTPPGKTDAIRKHLQRAVLSLQSPLLRDHPGSFQIVTEYLNAEIALQQYKLNFNEASSIGPDEISARGNRLLTDLQSIKSNLGNLQVGRIAEDGLVDVDAIDFAAAVQVKSLEVALLIARLQILLNLPSDDIMNEISTMMTVNGSSFDTEYQLEHTRLQLLRNSIVPAVFRGMIGTLNDPSRQAFITGWSLLNESNWAEVFRVGGTLATDNPQWLYWLAKAQAIHGSDFVQQNGGHYNPSGMFRQYLDSPRVSGDSYFRDDAKLHLLELRFINAVNLRNRDQQKSRMIVIRDELVVLRPQHKDLKARVRILEEVLSVYRIKIQSVSLGGADALVTLIQGAATASSEELATNFLNKVQNLLTEFRQNPSRYPADMVAFFISVKDYVYVHWNTGTDPQCENILRRAMERLDRIPSSSGYYQEGQYLAAICSKEITTFFDNSQDARTEAISRLTGIAQETGNARALYHLADIYFRMSENSNEAPLAQMVKRVIGDKLGTSAVDDIFYNAADLLSPGQYSVPAVTLPLPDGQQYPTAHFSYPYASLRDHPGLYLEKFATHDFLLGAMAKKLVRSLSEFYPYPVAVYPSNNTVGGWLLDSCDPTILSGINDGPMQVRTALKMMVMTETMPLVMFDGLRVQPSVINRVFEVKDLEGGSIHNLKVTCPGYFPFTEDHKFKGTPFDKSLQYLYLAAKTTFSKSPTEFSGAGLAVTKDQNKIYTTAASTVPQILKDKMGFEVRDFVQSGDYYYYVNTTKNSIDRITAQSHGLGQSFLTEYGQIKFKSPEGIATDRDGNIYVTDFGNHHVVVFDSAGKYLRHFGTASGEAPLQFPTRLVLEEDLVGFTHNGTQFFRPAFLYVADWNGVHRMDLYGNLIDTIAKPGHKDMQPGDFYGIGIVGYGPEAELIVLKRDSDKALKYTASPTP